MIKFFKSKKCLLFVLVFLIFSNFKIFAQEQDFSSQNQQEISENQNENLIPLPIKKIEQEKDKMSFGSFALIQSRKSGGGLTFAIPIFQKNSFIIRDEIMASLYLSNLPESNGTLISLGDKIIFGSLKNINGFGFRTYGYMKCEFGASRDSSYAFFKAPLILELGGAGGFEFLFTQKKGFFIEFGGGAAIKGFGQIDKSQVASGCFNGGYVCLTTGMKHYF